LSNELIVSLALTVIRLESKKSILSLSLIKDNFTFTEPISKPRLYPM
jgi:hypothetical protein